MPLSELECANPRAHPVDSFFQKNKEGFCSKKLNPQRLEKLNPKPKNLNSKP